MINVRYIDELLYSKKNYDDPATNAFNTSSSSSIDSQERARRGQISDLTELMRIYLSLPSDVKETLKSYFDIPPKIRGFIECRAQNPGMTQSQIAIELGVSRRAIYDWIDKMKETEGVENIIALLTRKPKVKDFSDSSDFSVSQSSNTSCSTSD